VAQPFHWQFRYKADGLVLRILASRLVIQSEVPRAPLAAEPRNWGFGFGTRTSALRPGAAQLQLPLPGLSATEIFLSLPLLVGLLLLSLS